VLGGEASELVRPVLQIVQRQPPSVTAERVGENDVGAGIDEALMQGADAVGMRFVPPLRGIARGEAHVEEIGAGGAVGEEDGTRSKEVGEGGAHSVDPIETTPDRSDEPWSLARLTAWPQEA